MKKDSVVWKLNKPFYGLNDSLWIFWLKVGEVLAEIG